MSCLSLRRDGESGNRGIGNRGIGEEFVGERSGADHGGKNLSDLGFCRPQGGGGRRWKEGSKETLVRSSGIESRSGRDRSWGRRCSLESPIVEGLELERRD